MIHRYFSSLSSKGSLHLVKKKNSHREGGGSDPCHTFFFTFWMMQKCKENFCWGSGVPPFLVQKKIPMQTKNLKYFHFFNWKFVSRVQNIDLKGWIFTHFFFLMSIMKTLIWQECNCGVINDINLRITGGKEAPEYVYPWIVNLFIQTPNISDSSQCVGSLISNKYIRAAFI